MNVLDLDQLRTFVAIAEIGSFTAAADVVHKTQSPSPCRCAAWRSVSDGRSSCATAGRAG